MAGWATTGLTSELRPLGWEFPPRLPIQILEISNWNNLAYDPDLHPVGGGHCGVEGEDCVEGDEWG